MVYLKDIKALAGISGDPGSGLTIGAGTLLAAIVEHKAIRESYPALWQSTLEVGTPQIRNMATLGGNLLQRPRCWYFRAGNGLLAMKDGKSLVRAGDNRYHAIFMTDGDALFVNPSSLAVPLIALGAKATITGPEGRADRPGRRPLPGSQDRQGQRADRRSRRAADQGHDPAGQGQERLVRGPAEAGPRLAAGAGLGQPDAWTATRSPTARVVIYGVAPIPWRSAAAEKAITGKPITHGNRRGRRRGRHRGGQAPVDERLQGRPDQDRRQAGLAGRRRQPLLGRLTP